MQAVCGVLCMGRKPTAQDVSIAAGVSRSTVDRVLNNRGGVTPDKERRVLLWARRLGLDRALDLRAARTLQIAIILQQASNPFHAEMQKQFRAASLEMSGLNLSLSIFHMASDRRKLMKLIESVGSRYDGLMVSLSRSPEISAALIKVSRNIPLITVATDIPDCGRQAYVGPDDIQAGRVAGDLLGRFIVKDGGKVLVIAGALAMEGQERRIQGFGAVMSDRYPQCRILPVRECGDDENKAHRIAVRALQLHSDIQGIYVSSQGARAVAEALDLAGRSGTVSLVTHELTTERRQLLLDKRIDAVIDQDPAFEVRVAIQTMACLLGRLEGSPESRVTPIHIHMIENA